MINKRRRKEIEELANNTRYLAGVYSLGINDIFDVCQALNYYYLRYPLNDGVLGAVMKNDGQYIIYSNTSEIYSREIFTVAHELGHIQLGHLENNNSRIIENFNSINSDDENEKEANLFAACLLMPEEKVSSAIKQNEIRVFSTLDIVRLQSVFNTSFDSTINRLKYLGLINECKYDELKKLKNECKIGAILKSIGNDVGLCNHSNVKSISMDYFKWLEFNYSNQFIPKDTVEKALGYLDIPFDYMDFSINENNADFDFDAFWEEDEE